MPLTFPSHSAAILPLKTWRPRWFDGVALVLGSTTPDLPYAFVRVLPYTPSAHNLLGVVFWCLPVTLLGCWLARRSAPFVAAHLPGRGREYGVLGLVRHRWYITMVSALLGALSHLLWDGFTHGPEGFQAWGTRLLPVLTREPVGGVPLWALFQHGSTVLGAVVAFGFLAAIGRRGLLRQWHGEPPTVAARPWVFWPTAMGTTTVLAVVSVALPGWWYVSVLGVRLLISAGLGVVAGAMTVRIARAARQPVSTSP